MKNKTKNYIIAVFGLLLGLFAGCAITIYFIFNWAGNLIIHIFNLSPEESAQLLNNLMGSIGQILKAG